MDIVLIIAVAATTGVFLFMLWYECRKKPAMLHRGEPCVTTPLRFDMLRKVNDERSEEWMNDEPLDENEALTEFIGEVGEAANILKKLNRISRGVRGKKDGEGFIELQGKLADEFGDMQITLDRWASVCGFDLASVTIQKFNKTSVKNGFDQRL